MEIAVILFLAFILLLPILYHFAVPLKPPYLDDYFTPGNMIFSESEGIKQIILEVRGRNVYSELTLLPQAQGPPEHMHKYFDESFVVSKGELTIKLNNEIFKIPKGNRFKIPKGMYHRIYNETDKEVTIRPEHETDFVPLEFTYSLAQLYPLMDSKKDNGLKLLMKLSVLDELFDSIIKGPHPAVIRVVKKILKPYARIFGVTPYDEKSRPTNR